METKEKVALVRMNIRKLYLQNPKLLEELSGKVNCKVDEWMTTTDELYSELISRFSNLDEMLADEKYRKELVMVSFEVQMRKLARISGCTEQGAIEFGKQAVVAQKSYLKTLP